MHTEIANGWHPNHNASRWEGKNLIKFDLKTAGLVVLSGNWDLLFVSLIKGDTINRLVDDTSLPVGKRGQS